MFISRSLLISGASLAAAVLMKHAPPNVPATAAPRTVLYAVQLDHPEYRSKLGDPACQVACQTLTNTIADAVGEILRSNFKHVRWSRSGAANYSIVFSWIRDTDRDETLGTDLQFSVLSSQGQTLRTVSLDFEDYRESQPRDLRSGWTPAAMAAEWMPVLSGLLRKPDLRQNVFTELPLDATVTFGTTPPASITVSYASIGRSRNGATPTFRVRAMIDDALMNTNAEATITLDQCIPRGDSGGYSCQVSSVRYISATAPDPGPLVARSTIAVQSIHVNELLIPSADSTAASAPRPPSGGER
jgi:hypothetical protein